MKPKQKLIKCEQCEYCGEILRKGYVKGKLMLLSYMYITHHSKDWMPHYCNWEEL